MMARQSPLKSLAETQPIHIIEELDEPLPSGRGSAKGAKQPIEPYQSSLSPVRRS